tara:strand:- start:182 stop:418 length:237 start_codon:yes stop_codon:yes gene_type:complete
MKDKLTLSRLKLIREEDKKIGANTYIVPVKGNQINFIRDELCFLMEVSEQCFTFFRSMDGKMYTMNEGDLEHFKLVGR